jgi:hypothetical protein
VSQHHPVSPTRPDEPRSFNSVAEADEWGRAAFRDWASSLSEREVHALARYQNSGHRGINAKLRRGQAELLTEREFQTFAGVDRATRKGRAPEKLLAFRGMGPGSLLAEANNQEALAGRQYRDAGFGSASLLRGVAREFAGEGGLLVEILVPAGTPGAYLNASPAAKDKYRDQCELLLARDLLYNVVGILREGDVPTVRMEICLDQE